MRRMRCISQINWTSFGWSLSRLGLLSPRQEFFSQSHVLFSDELMISLSGIWRAFPFSHTSHLISPRLGSSGSFLAPKAFSPNKSSACSPHRGIGNQPATFNSFMKGSLSLLFFQHFLVGSDNFIFSFLKNEVGIHLWLLQGILANKAIFDSVLWKFQGLDMLELAELAHTFLPPSAIVAIPVWSWKYPLCSVLWGRVSWMSRAAVAINTLPV